MLLNNLQTTFLKNPGQKQNNCLKTEMVVNHKFYTTTSNKRTTHHWCYLQTHEYENHVFPAQVP